MFGPVCSVYYSVRFLHPTTLCREGGDCRPTGLRLYLDKITVAVHANCAISGLESISVEQLVCGAEDQDDTWQQVAGVFLPISS